VIYQKIYNFSKSTQNRKEKLVLVREGFFYALKIEKYKSESSSLNRGIISTPNIIYYDSNTKCLIDYSNQTNNSIDSTVSNYFTQIPHGCTFTLYNGIYNDVNLKVTADISGTYRFKNFYNGIVEADVVSTTNLSSKVNRYDKNRFEQIPYIIPVSLKTDTVISMIKNRLGADTKNSFNYLSIKIGDYVKITEMTDPVKVLDINTDSDGNEYVLLDADITTIDLTDTKTTVSVYIPVIDSYKNEPSLTETEVGACIEYFNGVVINCTNNSTLSQCRFRSSEINKIETEITIGTFCATPETDTAIQKDTTDSLITITSNLVNAVASINTISGPVLKNNNSKNSFYGRPF
jgi:hypothetical protein